MSNVRLRAAVRCISFGMGFAVLAGCATISTHKIDPDVDETRSFMLMDLVSAGAVERFGYERGVGAAPVENPRENLTGDPYVTDGLRLVLFISDDPVPVERVDRLEWEISARH